MCEIYKALQQAMKLVHKSKDDEQLKDRLILVGLLSQDLFRASKERIMQIDDSYENEEKLH